MSSKEPIHLKLPKGFTKKDVQDAISDDFVKKVHDAFTAGADEVVVTTKKEGPTP